MKKLVAGGNPDDIPVSDGGTDVLLNRILSGNTDPVTDPVDEKDEKNVDQFLETYDPKEKSSEDVLEGVENIKKLHYYISKLGKKCQEIFRLYMEVEGSFLELSKRMNIPLGTVQSRWHRCKEKLLKIILKESPGEANEI